MGNSSTPPLTSEDSPVPPTQKINTLASPVHILPDSFDISGQYLGFICNCIVPAEIVVRFFMHEDGMVLIQDSTRPLPCQDFQIDPGFNIKLKARLNQAYIDEFTYETPSSFPIVIEANTADWSEITILEIRFSSPRVIQQRIICNEQLYEIRGIFGVPVWDSEERDKLCVVCLYNVRDTISEPCCHFCMCSQCANLMRSQINRRCPMCRKGNPYAEIHTFISITPSSASII